jgi:hypothetical protein
MVFIVIVLKIPHITRHKRIWNKSRKRPPRKISCICSLGIVRLFMLGNIGKKAKNIRIAAFFFEIACRKESLLG